MLWRRPGMPRVPCGGVLENTTWDVESGKLYCHTAWARLWRLHRPFPFGFFVFWINSLYRIVLYRTPNDLDTMTASLATCYLQCFFFLASFAALRLSSNANAVQSLTHDA